MAKRYTDEFCRDVAWVATASGVNENASTTLLRSLGNTYCCLANNIATQVRRLEAEWVRD